MPRRPNSRRSAGVGIPWYSVASVAIGRVETVPAASESRRSPVRSPSFGRESPTLARQRRPEGGLDDEPRWTFDVMLPGDFPHAFCRFGDPRELTDAYESWVQAGRIVRVRE